MISDRRAFMETVAASAAFTAMSASGAAAVMQTKAQTKTIKALAFDAYGTLFDVFSVTALCDTLFPGSGTALAQLWRMKQLQYSLLRSMMDRYKDFWQVTEDGLVFACKSLKLDLTADSRTQLMNAYLSLAAFPDVKPGLEALRKRGLRLAILSNGEPKMLAAVVKGADLTTLLDAVISVDDVKIYKPNPRVYALASQRLRVRDAELGFVSSNSFDITGAASTGLHTFWIQRSTAEPPEELGYAADRIVHAITDLPGLV